MSDGLIIKRMGVPEDGIAKQDLRIEQVLAMLQETPSSTKTLFVAGEEVNGCIPVTQGRWRASDTLWISEVSIWKQYWDPNEYLRSINQKSSVSRAELRKAAGVLAKITRGALHG